MTKFVNRIEEKQSAAGQMAQFKFNGDTRAVWAGIECTVNRVGDNYLDREAITFEEEPTGMFDVEVRCQKKFARGDNINSKSVLSISCQMVGTVCTNIRREQAHPLRSKRVTQWRI